MKKLSVIVFLSLAILFSCKTTEVIIPEGTDPEVATLMKDYYLQKSDAEKLINALENQSGLVEVKLSDITYVSKRTIRGRNVLEVRTGRNTFYVNLD